MPLIHSHALPADEGLGLQGRTILICIPNLNVFGGTEIHTQGLVHCLAGAGARIVVCCYFLASDIVIAPLKEAGAEVIMLGCSPDRPLGVIRAVSALTRSLNPDLVHVQYVAPGLLPILGAWLGGATCITATLHQVRQGRHWLPKVTLMTATWFCTKVACVSEAAARSWFGQKKNSEKKVAIVHNGVGEGPRPLSKVDRERIRALRTTCAGRRVIGAVGRLRSEKNQAFLLKVMGDVICDLPEALLLVIGTGPDKNPLEHLAFELGLKDHVLWAGELSPGVVDAAYGLMEVVAVPSLQESFGYVAAEAMAHGRPVVAFDVEGLREVMRKGESGFLVAPGDAEGYRKALLSLLTDQALAEKMGLEGRRWAEEAFSTSRFESDMKFFFDSAMDQARRRWSSSLIDRR